MQVLKKSKTFIARTNFEPPPPKDKSNRNAKVNEPSKESNQRWMLLDL